MIATVLMIVGGTVAAIAAATSIADNDAANSSKSLQRSAAGIAASLQLAITHQDDLAVNASGFMVTNPNASQTVFQRWAQAVQLLQRYPAVQGIGALKYVPASQLAAFANASIADPAGALTVDGGFTITPPGPRAFYCFVQAGLGRPTQIVTPAGFDYCAGSGFLMSARASGQTSYYPYADGSQTWLAIETPFYSAGVVPPTTALRESEFAGWIATQVNPTILLSQAMVDYPNMSVSMHYHDGSSDANFTYGHAPTAARSVSIDLGGGWTVHSAGAVDSASVLANRTAIELLIAGVGFSVLLGVFMFVLATGRERARRLVGLRTGELRHQALHDSLTGLPNRALVMDRIDQLLVRNRRHHTAGAVFYVDIDDFKNVNDTLGHQAGDRLLVAVTARLASALRDADTIGRMGGDEFVVLIDGVTSDVAPEFVAQRLLDVLRQPFEIDGASTPIVVSISIGIAVGDRTSADELLRDADVALYQAKAAGKNRYEVFQAEMQTKISRRVDLGYDLRSALGQDQFRLVYQPIYSLDDLTVVGVEALLRWDHPTEGLISPVEFIPILEQTGQIREVGRWTLHQACAQMAAWHARGDTLDVSVNISGRQLDDDSIIADIGDALNESGLPATSLIVEITETALMHNTDDTARRLGAIKELGVRIAVDDFGTGYSSLAYLRQFPVDCLKIDRMFTSAITTSPESRALIGTLVQLGKDLGLSTLAEGVETTDEMDMLRGAKVDQAQGFLMARPVDPQTLEHQFLAPTRDATATRNRR
jgi:diguanylate cyclase (GGDEF)-like protein